MNAARPVLIMAGGTGGHVFPALAVAERLRERGLPVVWLGTRRGLEATLVPKAGIPIEWIMLAGFSQGACLASEYVARQAQRYGGLLAFSGGLIGPPGTPRDYQGMLEGTPVFIGCSDVDPHIPLGRVAETAAVLARLGATVDKRIYPRLGHTINDDEIAAAAALVRKVGA